MSMTGSLRVSYLPRQQGLGLVELMVGLLVGMIVVAAATSLLTNSLASSNDNIKMARLDQELRQVMTMVSRDLRRATTWDAANDVAQVSTGLSLKLSATSGTAVTVSTEAADLTGVVDHLGDLGDKVEGGTLIHISDGTIYRGTIGTYNSSTKTFPVAIAVAWPTSATESGGVPAGSWSVLRPQTGITLSAGNDCILAAADFNASGTFSTSSPNEFFGYRHVDTASEKVVKIKTASTGLCTTSMTGWENLTDENIVEITTFTITDNSPSATTANGLNIAIREYTIKIVGRLKAAPSVQRILQTTVRVRNDALS